MLWDGHFCLWFNGFDTKKRLNRTSNIPIRQQTLIKKKSNLIYTISSFIRTTVTTVTLEEALVWRKYERLETRPVYETNSASESVEVRGESYIIFKKCHWEMWDPSLLGLYPKLETKTHNIPASAAALFSLNLSPVRTHSYTLWRWNVSVCMCVF